MYSAIDKPDTTGSKSQSRGTKYLLFQGTFVRETKGAYGFITEEGKDLIWIPKSQTIVVPTSATHNSFYVAQWVLFVNGILHYASIQDYRIL